MIRTHLSLHVGKCSDLCTVQTEVVQLSSRRDPLRGFRKYEGGLVLHSTEYWVVCLNFLSGVCCEGITALPRQLW